MSEVVDFVQKYQKEKNNKDLNSLTNDVGKGGENKT